MKSFDRVAKIYRPLEHLAFGSDLMKTRTAFLADLTDARRVLILGEGDGRFVEQLLRVNPYCQVDCVDKSREMLRLARKRATPKRVTFYHHDALTFAYPARHYDLIITLFFLDVFTRTSLEYLVGKLAGSLKRGGYWYVADFSVPAHPLKKLHSLLWLHVMYRFFTWQTDMETRTLVDPTPCLLKNGLRPVKTHHRRFGMLYSELLQKV